MTEHLTPELWPQSELVKYPSCRGFIVPFLLRLLTKRLDFVLEDLFRTSLALWTWL